MPCFSPLRAYRSSYINRETGKRGITFNVKQRTKELPVRETELELPCGQCIGCRLEKSRQWAIRCMHEAEMHEKNCFITLTFNEEALYKRKNPYSVDVREFQLFMKRLRKKYGTGIRFFHCGEYGEKLSRPHYHACIFNFDFPDKKHWKTVRDNRLYISNSLDKLWADPVTGQPYGFSTIGEVNFETAAYVARYVTKKITGKKTNEHYNDIDPETGEILVERNPEYITMSRRPGIGKTWINKYADDVYPDDFIIVNGHKVKPPKFYDQAIKETRPYEFDQIKEARELNALKHGEDTSLDRLRDREIVMEKRAEMLKRNIEEQ